MLKIFQCFSKIKKTMTAKERLKSWLKENKITEAAFEQKSGLSNGAVSKFGESPRKETLDKIKSAYPELDIAWVLGFAQQSHEGKEGNDICITSPIAKRFFEVLELVGETLTSLSNEIPNFTANQELSDARTGRNEIQIDVVGYLCAKYPNVNAGYIITGIGEPFNKSGMNINRISGTKSKEPTSDQEIILYDINAAANLKTLLGDKTRNILGKITIPDIPKCDGAVYVKGDSMYPLLKSGDIIAYKEVHNFDNVVKGEMYLISFELDGDEYLTVKYVNSSDKVGYIKLVSYNPHHDPMDIPISAIYAMALVKVSIRMNTMR